MFSCLEYTMKMLTSVAILLCVYVWNYVDAQILLNPNFRFDRPRLQIEPIRPIPIDPIMPPRTLPPPVYQALDVVFIMDSTGSMSPYIENARQNIRRFVDEITQSSASDVHMALIEYRDHPPQDHTFVTRKHDFTSSVLAMKSWLDAAVASGGGDKPEAVADALYDATKLSWRSHAVKVGVLIADAPPHGLSPSEDSSFPQGCPNGHDPIDLTHQLVKKGVTMYSVGCEPSILPYKDFFMALAYVTGGQYIPLSDPQRMIDAIIGGAQEQLSLQAFTKDVQQEIQKVKATGAPVNEAQIAQTMFKKLSAAGAQTTHLLRNNQPLEEPSSTAKAMAAAKSMAEVRQIFAKAGGATAPKPSSSILPSSVISRFRPAIGVARPDLPLGAISGGKSLSIGGGTMMAVDAISADVAAVGPDVAVAGAAPMSGGGPETFSAVKSAISLDQIKRMVQKETAAQTV